MWVWVWEDEPGEAGPVTKGLLNHSQESGIKLKDQSNQVWLHRASPGKI